MNRGRPSAESENEKRIVWGLGERKRYRIVIESNGSVNWVGMYSMSSAWQIRDPFVIHGHEITWIKNYIYIYIYTHTHTFSSMISYQNEKAGIEELKVRMCWNWLMLELMLKAWNWPWWDYLQQRHWQMFHISVFCFIFLCFCFSLDTWLLNIYQHTFLRGHI